VFLSDRILFRTELLSLGSVFYVAMVLISMLVILAQRRPYYREISLEDITHISTRRIYGFLFNYWNITVKTTDMEIEILSLAPLPESFTFFKEIPNLEANDLNNVK